MILPAFFGHKKSINLLPKDSFESSTLGVILEWALVFGKWAVILTQLVVMGAFFWRFALDRELTDLRKSITKNVAVVKSYEQVERDYILAQKQVDEAKKILNSQKIITQTLSDLQQITTNEIWYDRITLSPTNMSLTAYAANLVSFGRYLTAVQNNKKFSSIRVGKLESSATKGAQIQFDLSVNLGESTKTGNKK